MLKMSMLSKISEAQTKIGEAETKIGEAETKIETVGRPV
jgi:hypothetical protein